MGNNSFYKGINIFVGKGNQAVQVLPHNFANIRISDTDTGAGVREGLSCVVAGKKPVLFPLAIVNCTGGAKGIAALGTNGDTTENAFSDMVVLAVIS